MYLDTDVILALVKQEDWLQEHIDLSKLQPAATSVITILEARLVLEREYGRKQALDVLSSVQKHQITLLPFTELILKKSQQLLQKYPRLNNFDSLHAAFALVHNKTLVSTDTLFPTIVEITVKDPRELS